MELVNKTENFSFLNLDMVFSDSTPENFANTFYKLNEIE